MSTRTIPVTVEQLSLMILELSCKLDAIVSTLQHIKAHMPVASGEPNVSTAAGHLPATQSRAASYCVGHSNSVARDT